MTALAVASGCTASSEARERRGTSATINEEAGKYLGVGLGDSERDVEAVLGRAVRGPTTLPLGKTTGGAGPTFIPNGCPRGGWASDSNLRYRRDTNLRYRHASFAACDRKVFAIVVYSSKAKTTRGVRMGDGLDIVPRLYPELMCGTTHVGDADAPLPYCTGAVAPRKHVWFGGDPIEAIALASVRLSPKAPAPRGGG